MHALLRRSQVVKATGFHPTYIAKLVKNGSLQVVKPVKGGRAFYRKEDIEKILQIKL